MANKRVLSVFILNCLQTRHWVRVDHYIVMDWAHVKVFGHGTSMATARHITFAYIAGLENPSLTQERTDMIKSTQSFSRVSNNLQQPPQASCQVQDHLHQAGLLVCLGQLHRTQCCFQCSEMGHQKPDCTIYIEVLEMRRGREFIS